ncbi:hypothetical protein GCK72_000937 [Caenorhabditis remanei]|uniref:Uncharacterized protein n=1 Tax=Caenorhabditis remanei TaxID=31234 RepID=A0A6A5HSD3_CAERE|nr:hypothetical protein GCK72_000937 [Caenorhabditis remanei]KAF1769123.1 hypothetical protein GCK72_000937 [Caenorhabditis remanei]
MARLLTSLENETELKAIERNNNICEKKLANFQRQREEVSRSVRHLEECNTHVKRMAVITKEKLTKLKSDVEKHKNETRETVQRSNAFLNSSFEQVDFIRTNQHVSLHCGPALSITLPYDSCIESCVQAENNLRRSLGEVSMSAEKLKSEKEALVKDQHSVSKAKSKAEKDIVNLKEEIERQTGIVKTLQASSVEVKSVLREAKEEVDKAIDKKAKMEEEMKKAQQTLDNLLPTIPTAESAKQNILAELDELFVDLKSDSPIDLSSYTNLSDCEEILKLFEEWKTRQTENSNFSQPADVFDTDTPTSLEADLENVKKQTKHTLKNVEQMKELREKHVCTSEMLIRKKSGVEAVRKQIDDHTAVLNSLKVTEKAVKSSGSESISSKKEVKEELLRQLEATRNEVPGPEPYQPYQTPVRIASTKTNAKLNAKTITRVSAGSGSTRNMSVNGPQYPGIKLVAQKNNVDTPIPRKVSTAVLDESANSVNSEDSSLISEDSGTTQDESALNQLFSPLANEKRVSPPTPPVVEFSMAAHMNEFSQRQAKLKASQKIKEHVDVERRRSKGKNVDFDAEDENDKRIFADESALDISGVDSEGDEENEEDDGDEFDELFAPDDQDSMDQSTWGDDD